MASGRVGEDYCARFVTVSEHLRDDFMEVVRPRIFGTGRPVKLSPTGTVGRKPSMLSTFRLIVNMCLFLQSSVEETEIVHGTDVSGSTRKTVQRWRL